MSNTNNKKACPELTRGELSRTSRRVFVAMSGGVDSSVAALLLKNAGYGVTGIFMKCVSPSTRGVRLSSTEVLGADCTVEADATDARRVAEKLEIPFYVWDFEEEYKRRVVDYMIEGYRRGETPNPDVMCNREIKFGIFFDRALLAGADYVATGHYVIKRETHSMKQDGNNASCFTLHVSRDASKDQSYFLWTLTEEKLKRCLFPIGDYLKSEVREIARKAGLPTAEKKDSQGICFLGKVTLADFLKDYIPEKTGEVLNLAGEKIGEHIGAHFYTIGQRQGMGNLKHQKGNTVHAPVYVAEKNVAMNTLTVAEGQDNLALYKKEVLLSDINFINSEPMMKGESIPVFARVRYRQPLFRAKLEQVESEKLKVKSYQLVFEEPQKFVASGQSAVFYSSNGRMLGGGVII